jgi:Glycosyl hydrolases family 6
MVAIGVLAVGAMLLVGVAGAAGHPARVQRAFSTPCADPYPAVRERSNPLMLATPPGANPLIGASFFVDGPAHGAAAGAIARLLGIDSEVPIGQFLPSFGDSESWAGFRPFVETKLAQGQGNPGLVRTVRLLEKIADQPEAQRVSVYAEGGGPGAIGDFARKLFCHNFTADPGTIPIISTYFLHPVLGGCATAAEIRAAMPEFKRRVDELVAGTGRRPVVYLLELDAIGSSSCMARNGGLRAWEDALRYEVDTMATLPHAVVYVEGGYSDANTAGYTARVLNAIDVAKIRGFFTNDTHINWTSKEAAWAEKVSKLTHGAHYIVNTAQNGNGPKLNPHPTTQGVEDLCNPPGRALGPKHTTNTGLPHADAFLWTHVPGNSSGHCRGGPDSGTFWMARAIDLAARANGKLGPGYPSRPY